MKQETVGAAAIPCYAVYADDSNYSDSWGNALVSLWIRTKQALVRGEIAVTDFRNELINGIIEQTNWRAAFEQAARDVGADPDDEALYQEYVALHRESAFELIPAMLHAEFCYLPEWDGHSLDDLLDSNGLRSDIWKSSYIGDIQPGNWLAVFLRMVNQSTHEMIAAAIARFGADGIKFADKCSAVGFEVVTDPTRPSLMTGAEVIETIENAYSLAVPTVHCEINVRALFEHDPTKPMQLTSSSGKVHLGLHEGIINGAGAMDSYVGTITVPAGAAGFLGAERQRWGINETYGIVRSCFHATPVALGGES